MANNTNQDPALADADARDNEAIKTTSVPVDTEATDGSHSDTEAGSEVRSTPTEGQASGSTIGSPNANERDPEASPPDGPPGSSGRWWVGVVVGTLVSLPLAWLLSFAASLPFFIGIFFFALFGLMVGAVVYRTARGGRPHGRASVAIGTVFIVLVGWCTSIVIESRGLSTDLAEDVVRRTKNLGDRSEAEYHEYIAGQIQTYVNTNYAPGGTLGYVRWVLLSGEIPKGELRDVPRTLRQPQRKLWWLARAVLSIGLFTFGVASQTFLLRMRTDRAPDLGDQDNTGDSHDA